MLDSKLRKSEKVNQQTIKKDCELSFRMNLRIFIDSDFDIPKNIDFYWSKIGCNASYIHFYDQISKPVDFNVIQEFFEFQNHPDIELSKKFQEFAVCMKNIFNLNNNFQKFLSQPKLTPNLLFSILPEDSAILFKSIFRMIDALIKGRTYQEQNYIITQFSKLLLPEEITKGNTNNDDISLFFPVSDHLHHYWAILTRDLSLRIYKLERDPKQIKLATFHNYIFNNHKLSVDGNDYFYVNKSSSEMLKMGIAKPYNILSFIKSFKNITKYSQYIPEIIKNFFIKAFNSSNFVLASAMYQSILDSHDENLSAILIDLIATMNESGAFVPFLRYCFMENVNKTMDPQFLFKNSSITTMIATALFKTMGSNIIPYITEGVRTCSSDPNIAIAIIVAKCSQLPTPLKMILSNAFKASRRKFPNNLIPLNAICDFFFFRFILPAIYIDPNLANIGKQIANYFIFNSTNCFFNSLDKGFMKSIIAFLLDISKLENKKVELPSSDFENIVKVLDTLNEKIVINYSQFQNANENPYVWSIVETIENCFLEPNEDFASEIQMSQLLI